MNYVELEASFKDLCGRYVPKLDAMKRVRVALLCFDKDPKGTAEEKAALEKHIADSKPTCTCVGCQDTWESVDTFKYQWCATCNSMVSDSTAHKHCPSCNSPVTKASRCGLCSTCCGKEEHATCNGGCNTHGKIKRCDHCQSCDRCCQCVKCDTCKEHVACSCHNVGYGSYTRCSCTKDKKAGSPWLADKTKKQKHFSSTRLAGVEWEYVTAGRNIMPMIKWQARWLGNVVRDESCGFEAVTPPIAGDNLVNCVDQLSIALKGIGAVVNERCSIHVHVDARDITWEDMYRLLDVYSTVEPLLYMLGGQERASNRYCYSVGHLYKKALSENIADRKEAVLAVALANREELTLTTDQVKLNARSHMRTVKSKHEPNTRISGRYKGINLVPWLVGRRIKAPDTTIEFRLHHSSLNKVDVLEWTKLCVRLVDWCAKASTKDCQTLPKSALRALCMISPESKDWIISKIRAWRKEYQANNRLIKVRDKDSKKSGWKISK